MKFYLKFKEISLIAGLFVTTSVCSQTLYPPKLESPNAASLGKFGEVPVSLFTGTPDISIPLHTLSYGNINVPIALRYHPSSVKPGQQPGWVGSGWDLESIGNISRQVRGIIDENYSGDANSGNYRSYYPYPSTSSQANATNFGCYLANLSNWNSTQLLTYDNVPSDALGIDAEADEFSFNVLGHSGKFYYEGITKGWQVASDENITVEMTEMFSPTDIAGAINSSGFDANYSTPGIPSSIQSRAFGSFTLTMPDGTKFIFGGKSGTSFPNPVEFFSTVNVINLSNPGSTPPIVFIANTWLLKSIIDVNGNVVTFNYIRKKPTCTKSYSASYHNVAATNSTLGCNDVGGGVFDKNKLSGVFQWPMYLTSIECLNESIKFSMSDANCNRYTNAQLSYADLSYQNAISLDISILGIDNWPNGTNPGCLNNLQWERLDNITITDNMHNSNGINNYNPNTLKQFQFNYLNTPGSPNKRLMLGSLQYLDNKGGIVGQYKFDYNSDLSTKNSPIPIYADGNFTDHWGFYNGIDLPVSPTSDFITYKQPQPTVVTIELLNKITYPTGGYTSLIWEPNDYSQIVSLNRSSLNSSSGYGGGCRIAEIKNVLTDGTTASDKKYYYKNGYTANTNINTLTSSGVLNGTPNYLFQFNNRFGARGSLTFGGTITSMIGIGNFGYTGQGSPIGYKEVDEVNLDGSYTKNIFTNYDADLNGVSHWDIIPSGFLGWDPNNDTYFQRNSLEKERGKPIGIFSYTATNTLLQKTIYSYRSDPARFTYNTINVIENTGYYRSDAAIWSFFASGGSGLPPPSAYSCSSDAMIFVTARSVYNYSYYPVLKTLTTYDELGTNPITQTTQYTYNPNNLLRSKSETNSKSNTIVTNYSYPTDNGDATSVAMTNAHILTPVIQTSITNSGATINVAKTNYFQPYTNIFVPQDIQIQIGNNSIETREKVNQYDTKGHIQEVQKTSNIKEVYIWGCNSQYILAKIINSDYNTAKVLVDQSKLDQAGVGYNNYTDADIRTELNKLRTGLPNAQVTTYTYACGIGISSETDPNGITRYYNYDAFGRLETIKDKDNNILKKFCYNYAGQPENCTTAAFSSDQQQAVFTKAPACATGLTTPTYTYTMPAGSYTSYTDKATANQLAIAAMNTNGQAAANSLPCLAAFGGLNSTSTPWNITVNNTAGTFTNTYTIYPGSAAVVFANVPVGTYSITAVQTYSGSITTPLQLILNGTTYTGTSFSLSSISINGATSFTLQPPPSTGPCSFTMFSGYSSPSNSISNSGGIASFYIVFYSTGTIQPGNTYTIATINGACRPSAARTISYSSSGRTWTITIYPNGQMSWQLGYSSPALNPNTTISTSTLSYNL